MVNSTPWNRSQLRYRRYNTVQGHDAEHRLTTAATAVPGNKDGIPEVWPFAPANTAMLANLLKRRTKNETKTQAA